MTHQPISSAYDGQTGTCKPSWKISKDLERDSSMSAEEAQAYEIIESVADSL